MNLKNILLPLFLLCSLAGFAQKKLYIPNEWNNPWNRDTLLYKESDPDCKYTWSKTRSAESDNFIVYWDKYYGQKNPTDVEYTYRFDIKDLLAKAEQFYELNIQKLGFADANSNVHKYKMMILLNHTTDWVCYGGGYDFVIGALWLSPSTSHPVGSSVAHEIGHSFQYMAYTDKGGHSGFHDAIGNGATIWEQTAQWQSVQSYPNEKYSQSTGIFLRSANLAFTHEFHRYQSYWFHYYLAEKYGIDFIGKIWRYSPVPKAMDFNEVLMKMQGWTADRLYSEYFDYAMKMATFDLEACRADNPPIGQYAYSYVPLAQGGYQVAYSSCPQSTGFNVIALNIPSAGETLTTLFSTPTYTTNGISLPEGDPQQFLNAESQWEVKKQDQGKYNKCFNNTTRRTRGFRLGYVALMKDGSRQYFSQDSVYCQGYQADTCAVSMTVPEGVSRLYLVVSPAPTQYFQHQWDESIYNDDQWPYILNFENTNIAGAPIISDDIATHDVDIYYDVHFPRDTQGYSGISIPCTGSDATLVGTAFQMASSEIASRMSTYTTAGPKEGKIMFYPLHPSTGNTVRKASTANGYGHWFNASGTAIEFASGVVYSEFTPSTMTFVLGQKPGSCAEGKTYKMGQALKFNDGQHTVDAKFHFTITIDSTRPAGYEITDLVDAIQGVEVQSPFSGPSTPLFDLQGRSVSPSRPGLYIKDGRKVLIK